MRNFFITLAIVISIPFVANAFEIWTSVEQGGLIIGKTNPGSKLYYNNKRLKTANDGRFMIGVERDAPGSIKIKEILPDNTSKTHTLAVRKRDWNIQRIDGIAPEKVEAPHSEWERIQKEMLLVKKAREFSTSLYFPTCFKHPIRAKYIISSVFGSQRIYNGIPKNYHGGLDYAAPKGINVRATAKGKIRLAYDEMYYSGKTVIIDHGFGIQSTYMHMSKLSVKEGDFVQQGQKIGEIGTTGRSTGPHLHFEIAWNGTKLDPAQVLKNSVCNQ